MIIVFLISKRPSGLIDMIVIFGGLRFSLRIKFEGGVRGKNVFKDKISLLVGELIRKINWLGKGNIDRILNGKQLKQQFGVVLKKSFFDVLCGCRKGKRDDG